MSQLLVIITHNMYRREIRDRCLLVFLCVQYVLQYLVLYVFCAMVSHCSYCTRYLPYYTFSDQFWTICMQFGKSATNFDIAAAESCPTGRRTCRTAEIACTFSEIHALSPKLAGKRYSDSYW